MASIALGEKKQKVITQMMLEIIIVFVFAMVGSFIVGNIVSNIISSSMVEQALINQTTNVNAVVDIDIPWELTMYHPGMMSFDEMIETFDTSLTVSTVLLLFAVGGVIILISTIAPIVKLLRLEPKEILTLSQEN